MIEPTLNYQLNWQLVKIPPKRERESKKKKKRKKRKKEKDEFTPQIGGYWHPFEPNAGMIAHWKSSLTQSLLYVCVLSRVIAVRQRSLPVRVLISAERRGMRMG